MHWQTFKQNFLSLWWIFMCFQNNNTTRYNILRLYVANCFIRWNAGRCELVCFAPCGTLCADGTRWMCDFQSPDCYGCHVCVLSLSFSSASSSTNYSCEVMLCLRVRKCLSREETKAGCHSSQNSKKWRIRMGFKCGVRVSLAFRGEKNQSVMTNARKLA